MPRPPTEPPSPGWCAHCHMPCFGVWVDTGIGAYEYWGHHGVDTRWDAVSECCGEDILERDPACECCGCADKPLDRYGWCDRCNQEIDHDAKTKTREEQDAARA